ncbi:hypothetical protein M409DRAFT_69763 [Zasmidium cellare ATCC 36951]|uniref:Uncharacterized protein n=1 Tax=Zasmidium cellare ATCC 36951 TaxID=1080233 RepID=A0A6A6C2R6_ZASCE|nr:uncharacterized protein M409DRAFT_69763 [Zasmidium cellare ATCC 36951]KAF2161404.1 hypothetical protein M409DRAFT_69763 [Zasmidium cellare ATCC 36951]
MDKMKGIAKGGWHSADNKVRGNSSSGGESRGIGIHRDTWKSDLKGKVTGTKKDPYEEQKNHTSRPLASLQDPDSFGPPPKHSAYYGADGVSRTGTGLSGGSASRTGTASSGPSGGWGASAVQSGYAQQKREREERERQMQEEQVQEEKAGPYRTDTSGLRTDHLPKPPVRRGEAASPAGVASPVNRTSSPALPPRQPPRQAAAPPPSLPPRQNEYPDEYTPAPPPAYNEALRDPPVQQNQDPAAINQGAATRLGQAGVSIPGFGIGGNNNNSQPESPATRGPPAGQLNELQQRFARMNTGAASNNAPSPASPTSPANGPAAAAAQKKAPPPPPPKKAALHPAGLQNSGPSGFNDEQPPPPPPLPMSSKPRP